MQTSTEAEEHLRVIRSLMERATIYRAISAPSALVGGFLAIFVAISLSIVSTPPGEHINFALVWLAVLVTCSAANLYFLRRDADRRREPYFSPGMRLALVSLLPSFLVAGACTVLLSSYGGETVLACIWVTLYGLALLATGHFAPRSIVFLGWAFLVAGLILIITVLNSELPQWNPWGLGNLIMAATFGLFHLIYAACTWPNRARSVEVTATP